MAVYQYSLNHKVRWVTWNETLSSALYSETKSACELVLKDKQECMMMSFSLHRNKEIKMMSRAADNTLVHFLSVRSKLDGGKAYCK